MESYEAFLGASPPQADLTPPRDDFLRTKFEEAAGCLPRPTTSAHVNITQDPSQMTCILSGELTRQLTLGGHEFFGIISEEDGDFVAHVLYRESSMFFVVILHPYYEALRTFRGTPRRTVTEASRDLDFLSAHDLSSSTRHTLKAIQAALCNGFNELWSVFDAWEKKLKYAINSENSRALLQVDSAFLQHLRGLISHMDRPLLNMELLHAFYIRDLPVPLVALTKAYNCGSRGSKKSIIYFLRDSRHDTAVTFLLTILHTPSESELWGHVLRALRGSNEEKVLSSLLRLASSAEGALQLQILHVLFSSGQPMVRQTLLYGLADINPKVREIAARYSIEFIDRQVIAELCRLLHADGDCRVRYASRRAICRLFRSAYTGDQQNSRSPVFHIQVASNESSALELITKRVD